MSTRKVVLLTIGAPPLPVVTPVVPLMTTTVVDPHASLPLGAPTELAAVPALGGAQLSWAYVQPPPGDPPPPSGPTHRYPDGVSYIVEIAPAVDGEPDPEADPEAPPPQQPGEWRAVATVQYRRFLLGGLAAATFARVIATLRGIVSDPSEPLLIQPETLVGLEEAVDDLIEDIAQEAIDRAGAIAAEAAARAAAIAAEAAARIAALLDMEADFDAAIAAEQTARATADAAEAAQRTTLAAQMRGSYEGGDIDGVTSGLLFDEREARATADAAEAAQRTTLAAQLRGSYEGGDVAELASGLLYEEHQARVAADAAEAAQRTTLATQMRGSYAGNSLAEVSSGLLYQERIARSTADASEVASRELLSAKLTGTADPSGLTLSTLSSGLLFDERQARVSANAARVSEINTLNATLTHPTTGLAAKASIVDVADLDLRMDGAEYSISAHAGHIANLQTGKANLSAQQALELRVTGTEGGLADYYASYSIMFDVNGLMSGYRSWNNGVGSGFNIHADYFSVQKPGGGAALTWNNGVLWNRGATYSVILGEGLTTDGDVLMWIGPNPASPAAASKSAAKMYVTDDGAAFFSGVVAGGLLVNSAMELGSTRIHVGGGHLAPFFIRDFGYSGHASTGASRTVTLSGFVSPGYGTGYHHKRFSRGSADVVLACHFHGDGSGGESIYIDVQYDGGTWVNIQSMTGINVDYRGGWTFVLRYTTYASWSTVAFRARTTQGRTTCLALDAQIDNTNETGNSAGSSTGSDASGGGGGSPPSGGGGSGGSPWVPPPDPDNPWHPITS